MEDVRLQVYNISMCPTPGEIHPFRGMCLRIGTRVDSPLSDARWQCKREPFYISYGYANIPQRAFIRIHMERGVLKPYIQLIISALCGVL